MKTSWVCLEHSRYAQQKAVGWWFRRSDVEAPKTVEEAIAIGKAGGLKEPKKIYLKQNGKYKEISGYEF